MTTRELAAQLMADLKAGKLKKIGGKSAPSTKYLVEAPNNT